MFNKFIIATLLILTSIPAIILGLLFGIFEKITGQLIIVNTIIDAIFSSKKNDINSIFDCVKNSLLDIIKK
jgi:hypothetical protein